MKSNEIKHIVLILTEPADTHFLHCVSLGLLDFLSKQTGLFKVF